MNLSALTIQQLRYLVAVDDHRSFREAATSCHVSQPALSTQLKKAEELLELPVFDRSRRPIVPTDRGARVIAEARIVLEHMDRIGSIAEADPELAGSYRLGVIPTLMSSFLPLLLPPFVTAHPHLELTVEETTTETMLRRLREGTLEGGLASTPLEVPTVHEEVVCRERLLVYLPPGHPLANQEEVHQAELVSNHLWLLSEGHCFRTQVLHLCSADCSAGSQYRVNFDGSSFETLIRLVDAGLGVTVLPELIVRQLPSDVRAERVKRFAAPQPARQIGFVYAREHARAEVTQALALALRDALPPEIERQGDGDVLSPVA